MGRVGRMQSKSVIYACTMKAIIVRPPAPFPPKKRSTRGLSFTYEYQHTK